MSLDRRTVLRILGGEYAGTVRELRDRMQRLRRELGDSDPPGPPPVAAPCP